MHGISLEPPAPVAHDGKDQDLFARPARLVDVNLEDGTEVFTRVDPDRSIHERLVRIWTERGDFSALTADSISQNAAEKKEEQQHKEESSALDQKEEGKPADGSGYGSSIAPQEIAEMQQSLLAQLEIARVELTTALDLLSVITPATDPPSVDPNTLPLPHQTLTIVPARPPPPPPTDSTENPIAMLPLAESLEGLKASARAFFAASELLERDKIALTPTDGSTAKFGIEDVKIQQMETAPPSRLWPFLLHLRSSPKTAYSLVPIGAQKNATLSGKNEVRAARQVGVFYGCEEAKDRFRRTSVIRAGSLMSQIQLGKRRQTEYSRLIVTISIGSSLTAQLEGSAVWNDIDLDGSDELVDFEGEERALAKLRATAFIGELFVNLSNEVRTDSSIKATLSVGKPEIGDCIAMEGHDWRMSISVVKASKPLESPPASSTETSRLAEVVLILLRLMFLQEYTHRRLSSAHTVRRSMLQTIAVLLAHLARLRYLRKILLDIRHIAVEASAELDIELFMGGKCVKDTEALQYEANEVVHCVGRILAGDKDLGGSAVIRITKTRIFHISYSLLLPSISPFLGGVPATITHQSLVLQLFIPTDSFSNGIRRTPNALSSTLRKPGTPITVPSMSHLDIFLKEQVEMVLKQLRKVSKK